MSRLQRRYSLLSLVHFITLTLYHYIHTKIHVNAASLLSINNYVRNGIVSSFVPASTVVPVKKTNNVPVLHIQPQHKHQPTIHYSSRGLSIIKRSVRNEDDTIASLKEPDENESNFGRQKYWNEFYEEKEEFSWYSPWHDIAPFFMEIVPLPLASDGMDGNQSHFRSSPRVLLPGIGNDSSMADMFDDGYTHLTAFDYAEEGVACARKFFGPRLLEKERSNSDDNGGNLPDKDYEGNDQECGVDLRVADARRLPYESKSFDAILEKGTLDAIYLSGGKDKELAHEYLTMAVDEFTRVTCEGGILMSISAACAGAIEAVFASRGEEWEVLRDGSFYMTEEGYSSNNIDATIFALKRTNFQRVVVES